MNKEKRQTEKERKKGIIDFLVNIPLFDDLKTEELYLVAGEMNFMDLEPGEILFKEGETGDYVCFVEEGSLEVLKRSEKGHYATLAILNRGRSIGEMAVIDEFPRSATVRARTSAALVILTRRGFDLILERHPAIGLKVLKGISRLLSQNLRRTSSRLADYLLPLS
jgi:CRP/FNR family transcriptional regulator, cyclic AMP receptor protein